jgi:hypothetical protein
VSRPPGSLARYRVAAQLHLEWCDDQAIEIIGGRWDLEDPISGLLLAAVVQQSSAEAVLSALCSQPFSALRVTSVWWPSALVDMIVNFEVAGVSHSLVLEHKHLNSPSNAPGYRSAGGYYWQTESMLREMDRVLEAGEKSILGGPFDPNAQVHLVVLDARGRVMNEIFELNDRMKPHRHDYWNVVSYGSFAESLRARYATGAGDGLVALLGQLFASERQ